MSKKLVYLVRSEDKDLEGIPFGIDRLSAKSYIIKAFNKPGKSITIANNNNNNSNSTGNYNNTNSKNAILLANLTGNNNNNSNSILLPGNIRCRKMRYWRSKYNQKKKKMV